MNLQMILFCHMLAFETGFILDLFLGDPHWLYHPVRLIGKLVLHYDNRFLGSRDQVSTHSPGLKRFFGFYTVVAVCLCTVAVCFFLLLISYKICLCAGLIVESFMTYQVIALKSLKVESMKVYYEIKGHSLTGARKAVSMIVGRDTENLDEEGVIRATVETVAENTSDGVIAPLFYLALGGPIFGFLYKAINTMDSMIGYKDQRYVDFGRFAAKLDDIVNFIPSRISALAMILSCIFLGRDFSTRRAFRIFIRDRLKHASPNSAQTESVAAGALGLRLAGPASYNGVVEPKEYIGDSIRSVENEDIRRSCRLMYSCSFICAELFFAAILIFFGVVYARR